MEDFLKQIVELWLLQFEAANKAKEVQFARAARRTWKYLGRDYQPLYYADDQNEHEFPHGEEGCAKPVIVGKSAEYVALMLPFIHAKVPHRLVEPSRPPLPTDIPYPPGTDVEQMLLRRQAVDGQDDLRAWLMQFWLNYTSHEGYDLAKEARLALPEALVKGECVLWTELTEGAYGLMPASFYDTIDSLYVDPDSEQLKDAAFIIRKRRLSIWRIAERFGIDRDVLRGQYQSALQQSVDSSQPYRDPSTEGDVGEYYEIWSRMGVGDKLVGAPQQMKEAHTLMGSLGQHVYLAVMRGVPYPLNLPPHVMEAENVVEELQTRMSWPIAFYENPADPWPCSELQFYPNAHDPWAQSPLTPGLQCQIFLDEVYYYLMRRVRTSCRDIIVTSQQLSEAIKDAIESGKDFEIVDYDGNAVDISSLIHIIEFPTLNKDLWPTIQLMERQFERVTGMTPLLAGVQPAATPRSATDVRAREGHATSRPDDFADNVEDWMSRIASKEAIATRLHISPPNELLGEPDPIDGQWPPESVLSIAWTVLVMTEDPVVAASELSYTVEAGSGRRRNKQKEAADATQLMQVLAQPYLQYGFTTGQFQPFNNIIVELIEANDITADNIGLPDIPMQAVPQEEQTQTSTSPTA